MTHETHPIGTGERLKRLEDALLGMMRAFCNPLFRRSIGGHNEEQQTAVLAAYAALRKDEEQA